MGKCRNVQEGTRSKRFPPLFSGALSSRLLLLVQSQGGSLKWHMMTCCEHEQEQSSRKKTSLSAKLGSNIIMAPTVGIKASLQVYP